MMRILLLIILCLPVSGCGLIYRATNVARAIYTEDNSVYAHAFSSSPTEPQVEIAPPPATEATLTGEQTSATPVQQPADAQKLNAIRPAADEEDNALYMPSGKVFDPLCLINNIGTVDLPIHPTGDCGRETIELITKEPQVTSDKKTFYVQYKVIPGKKDDLKDSEKPEEEKKPTDKESEQIEDDTTEEEQEESKKPEVQEPKKEANKPGLNEEDDINNSSLSLNLKNKASQIIPEINEISYTNLGTVQGLFALRVNNILSTGEANTSLGLYDFSVDIEDKDTLERKKVFADGDRCNGNLASYKLDAVGEVRYSKSYTPKSLVSIPYEGNDQALYAREPKFENLLSCPACCVGFYEYVNDVPSGLNINPTYITAYEEDQKLKKELAEKARIEAEINRKRNKRDIALIEDAYVEPPQDCFDRKLYAQYKEGRTILTNDDVTKFITDVEKTCFKSDEEIEKDKAEALAKKEAEEKKAKTKKKKKKKKKKPQQPAAK